MFKKKNFLARTSANNIAELMAQILTINSHNEDCTNGRRITLIALITDILVYQKDKEKITLTEKEFETILDLEYLNNLANSQKIKDKDLQTRLRQYLIHIPRNYNEETKQFEHSEISKEQHDYLAGEIKKILPVIRLLNSRDF